MTLQTKEAWRESLVLIVKQEAQPVEKFGHQPRLYELTQQISESLSYDDDIVFAAAYLHDLGVFTGHRPDDPAELARWNHVVYTVAKAPAILTNCGFPPEKIPAVLECIEQHQPQDEPLTLESTILRDADILEQLGAVGILRTVCKVGRDTRFHTFTDAVRSLSRALDTLPTLIRLPNAKKLAEARILIHRQWLEAVQDEAGELLL